MIRIKVFFFSGLAKVLCLNFFGVRIAGVVLALGWIAAYATYFFSGSVPFTAGVMAVPVLAEVIVALIVAVQASFLLTNSQLYLAGVRQELFFLLFSMCFLFSLFVFDPQNPEHLLRAKLVSFDYLSLGVLWLVWMVSLRLLALSGLVILTAIAIALAYLNGFDSGAAALAFMVWIYFGYWLWKSPLQKKFKYDDFGGVVDFMLDRMKIANMARALRVVRRKEHVILLEEGDGYVNRLLVAPALGLLFTGCYIIFMHQHAELCLFLILLLLIGNRSKLKVATVQKKLWLFSAGSRSEQFDLSEKLLLRLHLYAVIGTGVLMLFWIYANPSQWQRGVSAYLFFQVFVLVADYFGGIFSLSIRRQFYMAVAQMPVVAVLVFKSPPMSVTLPVIIVMLALCVPMRRIAKQKYLKMDFMSPLFSTARLS